MSRRQFIATSAAAALAPALHAEPQSLLASMPPMLPANFIVTKGGISQMDTFDR